MPRPRRVIPAFWMASLCVALPASASGAVTIGSSLEVAAESTITCASLCTASNSALPDTRTASGGLVAPSDGVVVRWRITAGSQVTPVALRITRPGSGPLPDFTGAGTGPTETPALGTTSTFEVRLPIQAGDGVGVDCCQVGGLTALASTPGSIVDTWNPLVNADVPKLPNKSFADIELLVNADIERDADNDGYGDETQDQCPTDASRQRDCTPPETTITKGAPNKTDKTKRKFKFSSSEPDSTFECKLDKKKFKPCSSPRKVKNLDEGKHKFKVRAIDAAGNVDPSPAKDRFKVVD